MATYVNNLRLKEITTGDESGTWGTSTNTNLELIGEALGFGTEGITTNADTHSTEIADGSSDAGRSMYIKYTGTLDSACTITITPNTMKRVHIIENGTSGSQNIIISQGSGANVTIPPGDTKVVYLDGAGSGAAVNDAFASLSVVDLKVQDDLSLTSDSAVLNIGADNDFQITHSGSAGTITNGTGDLTFDVAGDITFDAGGADIILKDDGTQYGLIAKSSNDLVITSSVSDGDLLLKGNDGGSGITALTLDMSEAGAATFNNSVTCTSLTVDDITINGSTISDSGTMTMDIGGDLNIDVAGTDINIKSDGTEFLRIDKSGTNARFESIVSDGDLLFRGSDGGSSIQALQLDMSAAGAATFNADVTAFSDKRLKTDISNIKNGLEKVMQMQGVYYKRNDQEDAQMKVGVLAQDMEAVVPEVVLTADDDMQTKSVDYGKLTAVLIEAIKDLKAEIDELKKG
tara:strand:+ start:361 stop:1740 length:1380 start_codon:yes stop_codon:yes gene_type:complete